MDPTSKVLGYRPRYRYFAWCLVNTNSTALIWYLGLSNRWWFGTQSTKSPGVSNHCDIISIGTPWEWWRHYMSFQSLYVSTCISVTSRFTTCPNLTPWVYHRDTTTLLDPKTLGYRNHNPKFDLGTTAVSSFRVMTSTSKVLGPRSGSRYAHGFKSRQFVNQGVTSMITYIIWI